MRETGPAGGASPPPPCWTTTPSVASLSQCLFPPGAVWGGPPPPGPDLYQEECVPPEGLRDPDEVMRLIMRRREPTHTHQVPLDCGVGWARAGLNSQPKNGRAFVLRGFVFFFNWEVPPHLFPAGRPPSGVVEKSPGSAGIVGQVFRIHTPPTIMQPHTTPSSCKLIDVPRTNTHRDFPDLSFAVQSSQHKAMAMPFFSFAPDTRQCSRVMEGRQVNVSVTGAGAGLLPRFGDRVGFGLAGGYAHSPLERMGHTAPPPPAPPVWATVRPQPRWR